MSLTYKCMDPINRQSVNTSFWSQQEMIKIYLKVTCEAHGLAVDDGSYVPVSMLDPTMVRKINYASSWVT